MLCRYVLERMLCNQLNLTFYCKTSFGEMLQENDHGDRCKALRIERGLQLPLNLLTAFDYPLTKLEVILVNIQLWLYKQFN